ncbi:MAG: hypothetical protein AAF551_08925 [Bacteroidota bacterium]
MIKTNNTQKIVVEFSQVALLALLLLTLSCQQDDGLVDELQNQETQSEQIVTPYSVSTMKAAVQSLADNKQFNKNGIDVTENYQYIQFKQPLSVPVKELEKTLDVYSYPVLSSPDAEEVLDAGSETYYAIIPVSATPASDYVILSSLYLPEVLETEEREQDLVLLESKAYELAKWTTAEEASENARLIKKWRPGGTITGDLFVGEDIPIEGIKVRMARGGQRWSKTAYTNENGKFVWSGARPLGLVRYYFYSEKYDENNEKVFSLKEKFYKQYSNSNFPTVDEDFPYFVKRATKKQFNVTLDYRLTEYYRMSNEYDQFKDVEGIAFDTAPAFTITDTRVFQNSYGIFEIPGLLPSRQKRFDIATAYAFNEIRHNYTLNKRMRKQISRAFALQFMDFAFPSDFLIDATHELRVFIDLIDDDQTPQPNGYGQEKDGVSGFTLKEVMESLEGVVTFSDWQNKLIDNARTPEEAEQIRLLVALPEDL